MGGGVEIVYKKLIENEIGKITRRPSRILTILLRTQIKGYPVKIICTYEPHMGYGKHIRDEYRIEIKEIPKCNNPKEFVIWAAENSGKYTMKTITNGPG